MKGVFSRGEEFIASTVRHPFIMDYKTGVTRDGRIVARAARLGLEGRLAVDNTARSPRRLAVAMPASHGPHGDARR